MPLHTSASPIRIISPACSRATTGVRLLISGCTRVAPQGTRGPWRSIAAPEHVGHVALRKLSFCRNVNVHCSRRVIAHENENDSNILIAPKAKPKVCVMPACQGPGQLICGVWSGMITPSKLLRFSIESMRTISTSPSSINASP